MANRIVNSSGIEDVTYTCPAGKSAYVTDISLTTGAGAVTVLINGGVGFSKTLTADSVNLSAYIGKIALLANQSITVRGVAGTSGRIVITVLESDVDYTGAHIITSGYYAFDTRTGEITDYNTTYDKNAIIPSTINSQPVTGIGRGVFLGKTLTGISIPSSVTSLGTSCFQSSSLTSLPVFSTSVTAFPNYCFYAGNLTGTLTIPSHITSIGAAAFAANVALTSLSFQGAATIGDSAFSSCTGLTGAINLGSCTSVGTSAFHSCSKITSVNLGNVTSIGNTSFYLCSALTTITNLRCVPGTSAFNGAPINSVSVIGGIDGMTDNAFLQWGFGTAYNNAGKAAGTYTYSGGNWTKTA